MKLPADPAVAAVFAACPPPVRPRLLDLRRLIIETAAGLPEVGPLQEALRWGDPAYLTPHSRSGSPIRINRRKSSPTGYAMYFQCQTTLVETFRTLFGKELRLEGNRAILFDLHEPPASRETLAFCIEAALTYHARKKRG
ncbi:MAG: DUF1801 domain-containing protein [Burkholderiales bacterium]|nr:MAG: DUF1801 domain-containing protein [Burkholderiales bacterium]